MTMYAHGYEVVRRPAADLTNAKGLRWLKRIAWLRLSGIGLSFAAWGLVFFVVRAFVG